MDAERLAALRRLAAEARDDAAQPFPRYFEPVDINELAAAVEELAAQVARLRGIIAEAKEIALPLTPEIDRDRLWYINRILAGAEQ